jgi:hypothetical protein
MRARLFCLAVCLAGLVSTLSCRTILTKPEESSTEGVGKPTHEGIPVSFRVDLPAQLGHELYRNLPFLAAASNPDGRFKNIRPLDLDITCESTSDAEHHCRLIYTGMEIKMKLADLLFRTMAGQVYVRRGCLTPNCVQPPVQIWWRTVKKTGAATPQEYDLEVCDIRGLEAGVSVQTPFAIGQELLNKVTYKPQILGFKASIAESSVEVVQTDENGQPLSSNGPPKKERVETYVAKALRAGFGPLAGGFPNKNCLLKNENEEEYFRSKKISEGFDLPVNKKILDEVPANFIRLIYDISKHIAKECSGNSMAISLRCQDIPGRPTCEIVYKGPQLRVPIPRYITGIVDAEVIFLRNCKNPGCRRQEQAKLTMTAYKANELETIEVCSVSGVELSNMKKFPLQARLLGAPDVKGMILRFRPGLYESGSNPTNPSISSPATLESFHVGVHKIGRYPTNNCHFVEN